MNFIKLTEFTPLDQQCGPWKTGHLYLPEDAVIPVLYQCSFTEYLFQDTPIIKLRLTRIDMPRVSPVPIMDRLLAYQLLFKRLLLT